jgi:hypothetical protein
MRAGGLSRREFLAAAAAAAAGTLLARGEGASEPVPGPRAPAPRPADEIAWLRGRAGRCSGHGPGRPRGFA